jgi:hypothetical protein
MTNAHGKHLTLKHNAKQPMRNNLGTKSQGAAKLKAEDENPEPRTQR